MFCTDLKTNNVYFPTQEQPYSPCKGDRKFTVRWKLIFVLFRLTSGFADVVPSFRQLVTVLSPRTPGFDSSPDFAKFMVDKTTLGQFFFIQVLRLPPVTIIPPMLHTHLHLNTILIIRTSERNVETIKQSNFLPDIGK